MICINWAKVKREADACSHQLFSNFVLYSWFIHIRYLIKHLFIYIGPALRLQAMHVLLSWSCISLSIVHMINICIVVFDFYWHRSPALGFTADISVKPRYIYVIKISVKNGCIPLGASARTTVVGHLNGATLTMKCQFYFQWERSNLSSLTVPALMTMCCTFTISFSALVYSTRSVCLSNCCYLVANCKLALWLNNKDCFYHACFVSWVCFWIPHLWSGDTI